jgi:hypothetical protein
VSIERVGQEAAQVVIQERELQDRKASRLKTELAGQGQAPARRGKCQNFFKGQNNVEWLLRQPLSRLKSSGILCLTGGRGKFEILQFQFKYFDVNEIRSFIFLRIITDVEI